METIEKKIAGGIILIPDGACGSYQQEKGLRLCGRPELWSIKRRNSVYYILLFILLCTVLHYSAFAKPDGGDGAPADNEFYYSVGLAAGGGFLFALDEPVRYFAQSIRSKIGDKLFYAPNLLGDFKANCILSAGLIIGGSSSFNESVEKTGLYLLESTLMAAVFTIGLKTTFGRARPYLNEGAFSFGFFEYFDKRWSFPSGHSALAFSMATILSRRINITYAYISCYSLSFLTMLSRINYDKHWLSDTFFGAAIGVASGLLILKWNGKREIGDVNQWNIKDIPPAPRPVKIFELSYGL